MPATHPHTSDHLAAIPVGDLLRSGATARGADARDIIEAPSLDLEGAAVLLGLPPDAAAFERLFAKARRTTLSSFGRCVHLFAPTYISSFCDNQCLYCAFPASTPVSRVWLSPPRAVSEIRALAARGLRRIVLVAGEAPLTAARDEISAILTAARPSVPELDLNLGAAGESHYETWRSAGAGGVVCFQETYDRPIYDRVHPTGPKADYNNRLETLEIAGRAGMQRLGLGILLGLGDPSRDLLLLIAHARYLETHFPHAQISASLPRIGFRTAAAARAEQLLGPPHSTVVDDEDFVRYVAVLRAALPHASIEISTREPAWLRERLLYLGANAMSVDAGRPSEAWVECQHDGGPDGATDVRGLDELRWDIEDLGFTVRWTAPVVRPPMTEHPLDRDRP